MKLLLCDRCNDVFKLRTNVLRRCACGRVCGKYDEDGVTAVVNGYGYSLALGNGSVYRAIHSLHKMDDRTTPREAYYASEAPTRIGYAWVRYHTGPGKQHTRIDKNLGEETP